MLQFDTSSRICVLQLTSPELPKQLSTIVIRRALASLLTGIEKGKIQINDIHIRNEIELKIGVVIAAVTSISVTNTKSRRRRF